MKKVKCFLSLTVAVFLLIVLTSCDFLFPGLKRDEDEYGVKAVYNKCSDKELIQQGKEYLAENFPDGTFEEGKIVENKKDKKIIEYFSAELNQNVRVLYTWEYATVYVQIEGEDYSEEVHIYSWRPESNFFALKAHPWEHSYTEIVADWFAENKVYFDYSNCFFPVLSKLVEQGEGESKEYITVDYKPEDFDQFMEEYNYSIFANATVDIAVKLPQGEDLEEYNEIFMFYLYYFIGSSRYSPKDEYCPCLNGSIYYLNEKTDIETVTSENLRDKKFVKENSIKVFEFRIAGDEYKESENE